MDRLIPLSLSQVRPEVQPSSPPGLTHEGPALGEQPARRCSLPVPVGWARGSVSGRVRSAAFLTPLLPFQNVAEVLQFIGGVALGGLVVVANQPTAPAVLARALSRMQFEHSQPPSLLRPSGDGLRPGRADVLFARAGRSVRSLRAADRLKPGTA